MSYQRTVESTFSAPLLSGVGHYAASLLSCGHRGKCEMKPTVYACGGCGREQLRCDFMSCPCGYKGGFHIAFYANPLLPEDRLTKAGDTQECETCKNNDADAQRLRELNEPVFRARYSARFGGQYHLYRRDVTSPSGVMLITTVSATPEVDAILASKQISPLSPTEDRS